MRHSTQKAICFLMDYAILNSWVNSEKSICFQLMESNNIELFYEWFKKWEEFVEFELIPID